MDVAHERGIVHRDLKPANILLAKLGSQSSMIRSRETDSSSLPADHWSRNTFPRSPTSAWPSRWTTIRARRRAARSSAPPVTWPEQAGGKNREIGPAADIYALGAILYELLVGRPPFKAGNPIDTIRQVIEQEPVPPRQLEPRVPHDLETICLKCLEKDPARRFASAVDTGGRPAPVRRGRPDPRPADAGLGTRLEVGQAPARLAVALLGVSALAVVSMVLFIVWHNVSLRGKLDVALAKERQARQRELDAIEERRLALVQQEGQKLFDSARVAVAAGDWPRHELDLEKALTTIGGDTRLEYLKEPADALLQRVEQELRVEADRQASRGPVAVIRQLRDEAQFLGTLYTGMDLAANLQAAQRPGSKM